MKEFTIKLKFRMTDEQEEELLEGEDFSTLHEGIKEVIRDINAENDVEIAELLEFEERNI